MTAAGSALRASRAAAAAHVLVGASLLARPDLLVRPASRPAGTVTGALARALAARHLLEGVLLLRTRRRDSERWGAVLEVGHIASMAAWRPDDADRRSFARRGAVLSAVFLGAHALISAQR